MILETQINFKIQRNYKDTAKISYLIEINNSYKEHFMEGKAFILNLILKNFKKFNKSIYKVNTLEE